jgi:MHS family citrate/tricarballylate:H+ symporter-like MFS transporter
VILSAAMPAGLLDAHGWRIAFLLGAVTLPFGLWLRSNLPETLHLPGVTGFIAETGANVAGFATVLYGGWLSDRVGRWRVNVWGNLAFVLSIVPAFYWITGARTDLVLIVGVTVLSAISGFMQGSFYAALAESLPKTIRGSGFGTVYSVSIAAFGGTTQLVVTWLIHVTGSAMAPAWYLLAAAGVGQVALMLMAESAPVRLAAARSVAAELPAVVG